MTNSGNTQPIKILQKTYHLPVMAGDNLKQWQTTIQSRQALITSGEEEVEVIVDREEEVPDGGFLGRGRRTVIRAVKQKQLKALDINDRFTLLETQIRDYDRLMRFLKQHKTAYQRFFLDLSGEVQQIIGQKCQQIAEIEAKRDRLQSNAEEKGNKALLTMSLQQKRQVIDSLILLDKGAVLMLKKINLISEGIEKLSRDNELSKQVLENMMAELGDYREAIALQRELDALQQEIADISRIAINFEHYIQQYLGPFQELVNDAAKIDGQLAQTVEEIRHLAEELMGSQNGFFDLTGAEQVSESLLTLEVARIQKQNRIADALEAAQNQPYSVNFRAVELSDQAVSAVSITEQIGHIQTHVNRQLTGLQGTLTIEVDAEPESPSFYVSNTIPTLPHGDRWDIDSVPLETEKGADYTELRDLLKAQKWEQANKETHHLIIVGGWQSFRKEDLLNFPCKDLKTIDRLWVNASQGRYGFSVQKEIYVRCGAKLDGKYPGDEIWRKFIMEIGYSWTGDEWVFDPDLTSHIYPQLFTSERKQPRERWLGQWLQTLFSRIKTCEV